MGRTPRGIRLSKGKKITRSIRLEGGIDQEIQKLADHQNVSVNFLVSKAVRRFVEWDARGGKFGFVSVPPGLLERMMEYVTEGEARELGRWAGQDLVRELVTFWFKEVNLETLLAAYPNLLAKYGHVFEVEMMIDDGRHTLILKHGLGRKWSAFHEEVMRTALGGVLKKPVRVEGLENQVMVRFTVP